MMKKILKKIINFFTPRKLGKNEVCNAEPCWCEKCVEHLLESKKENKCEKKVFEIGKAYFFRTVTYHLTGRVKDQIDNFLILESAAWIADSGRFTQAINKGYLVEVEPVNGLVRLNLQSITDAFEWNSPLPREQK